MIVRCSVALLVALGSSATEGFRPSSSLGSKSLNVASTTSTMVPTNSPRRRPAAFVDVGRAAATATTTTLFQADGGESDGGTAASGALPDDVDVAAQVNAATASSDADATPSEFEPGSHEELMYALGVNLARQMGDVTPLIEDGKELSNLAKGVLDVIVGKLDEMSQAKLLVSRKDDLNNFLVSRSTKLRQQLEEAGRAMINQMKQQENAIELPSGVVVHPLEPGPEGFGKGVRPTASSTVKVHYHGTLPDGGVFDSSIGGEPAQFALGQVVQGFKEGLLKMHEGETAMLGIPAAAGYGEQGSPDGRIPGGATLFFKVQLLEVLTAGIGGSPKLLGVDGKALKSNSSSKEGSGLLGADGKPL